jgi:cell division protein FtsQ
MTEQEGDKPQDGLGAAGRVPQDAEVESPIPRKKLGVIVGILVFAFTVPLWAPFIFRHLDFFRVRKVEIYGARYVPGTEILERLRVDTTASVWDDPGPLERRVATHPQVRTAVVHRKLPGTLVIEITENLPIALVPTSQGFRAFDARGVSLPLDPARTLVDVPILTERDTMLLRTLGELRSQLPGVYRRISEVRRTGVNEVVIQLGNVSIRAMRDVSVDRLAEVEPVEADVARRQLRLAEIDLRYRDQVIARMP